MTLSCDSFPGSETCGYHPERECRPLRGSSAFLIHFPGFRCAPPWAELWARLRRLVYRATKLICRPIVSEITALAAEGNRARIYAAIPFRLWFHDAVPLYC